MGGLINAGDAARLAEPIPESVLVERRAIGLSDEREALRREASDRLGKFRHYLPHHEAALLFRPDAEKSDRLDAAIVVLDVDILQMLAAEPSRITTAQAGRAQQLEREPLARTKRPPRFETLDLVSGPSRPAAAFHQFDWIDALGRIAFCEIVLSAHLSTSP